MTINVPLALWRGLRGRCPNCGKGRVLKGYLKQEDECSACGCSFREARTDDIAPYVTAMITGLILAPFLGMAANDETAPLLYAVAGLLLLGALFMLLLLPRVKGVLIVIIWLLKAPTSASHD